MYVWRAIANSKEDLLECHNALPMFQGDRHGLAMGDVRADCLLSALQSVDCFRTPGAGELPEFQGDRRGLAMGDVRGVIHVVVLSSLGKEILEMLPVPCAGRHLPGYLPLVVQVFRATLARSRLAESRHRGRPPRPS